VVLGVAFYLVHQVFLHRYIPSVVVEEMADAYGQIAGPASGQVPKCWLNTV
jgi:hypothetical protein